MPPGTDVMVLKIFSKKWRKNGVFSPTNFCKNLIITLVFKENANFSPKIGKNRRIL
jgi:hypothetical protein